jgi:hypothetical protein
MSGWVDVTFDCLPLRSIGRLDVPLDASPRYQQRCMDIKAAMEKHGSHNSYYLFNAQLTFHLTNVEEVGMLQFRFEGTLLTDTKDQESLRTDLQVELVRETCDWLSEPIVQWFRETVPRSVAVEFNRYVESGDLEKTRQRLEDIKSRSDDADGFMGMYL